MALYPNAAAYLITESQKGKYKTIFNLELMELILSKRSFPEYQSLKQDIKIYNNAHVRQFVLLFNEWLDNKISELNINVYKGQFAEGQHIRYFRDFFADTREETTKNSKGTLIEMKAYGTSMKINREVISFEGRFYDDLLSSFTDKTDITDEYISNENYTYDIDIMENNISLIKELLENDCLDALDDKVINQILKDEIDADVLLLILERNMDLSRYLNADVIRNAAQKNILSEIILNLLNSGRKEVVQNKILVLATPADITLHDIHLLLKRDCIEGLSKEFVEKALAKRVLDAYEQLKELENKINADVFYFERASSDYMLPTPLLKKNQISQEWPINKLTVLQDWGNLNVETAVECYRLKDILEYYRNYIKYNYIFCQEFKDKNWTKEDIELIKAFSLGNSADLPLQKIELIASIASQRVSNSKKEETKRKLLKGIGYLVLLGGIIAIVLWALPGSFFQKKTEASDENITTGISDSSSDNENIANNKILKEGNYFASPDAIDGVILYKDKQMKKTLSYRLTNMEKIRIDKVEDSMGYFDSYMNDNYENIPKGWTKMKYLVNENNFFTYAYGEDYRVNSDEEPITIFKDYQKKKKIKLKLQPMDQIKIYKLIGDMAYFKDFYVGVQKYNGWVELSRISK
jgi:hypothetical protein